MRFGMPYLQPSFSPPTQTHFPRLFWGSLEISSLELITFSLRTLVVTCFSSSAALTSYHKHSDLKQHKGIPHGPCTSQVHCGSHRTEVEVLAGPHCLPEARGRTLSSPSNCRNQFLAAVIGWGRFRAGCRQGGAGIPWLTAPFLLQSQQQQIRTKFKFWTPLRPRFGPLSLCAHFCHHLLCLLCLPPLLRAHQLTLHPPG